MDEYISTNSTNSTNSTEDKEDDDLTSALQSSMMGSGTGKSVQREDKEPKESPVVAKGKEKLRVSSVIFVDQSRRGELASKMRETLKRLEPLLGFKMKVVENAGTSLGNHLSNKTPWAGSMCGRTNCHPCRQPSEKVENFKTKKIVYESRCTICN